MGIYRTYFDKNTVILSNSHLNTARNPIAQLFYGQNSHGTQEYSRLLIHFDVSKLQSLISGGTIMGEMKHTLKMKNTSFFDKELIAADFDAKKRAYSFDLILFKINEYWDEGAGYDVVPNVFETPNNNAYIMGPANWFKRTTVDNWSAPGIVDYETIFPDIITTQHFEFGNEDIEMDITDAVNALLTGDTNYGYCIAFSREYETMSGVTQQQYVGFYSRHTNTYYEPFIETTWNDLIEDDRGYFFMGRMNRIFYYATVDGQFVNLDSLPSVKILNENGEQVSAGIASQLSKGVYYYEFMVPEDPNLDKFQYSDVWNVTYMGKNKTITGKITLLNNDSFLPSSELCHTFINSSEIALSFYGISQEENIEAGELRRFEIDAVEPFTNNKLPYPVKIYYQLFIQEGQERIVVIDWQQVNRGFNNYFVNLDTSWLIPNIYYIDIKYEYNGEIRKIDNPIKFRIVNKLINPAR